MARVWDLVNEAIATGIAWGEETDPETDKLRERAHFAADRIAHAAVHRLEREHAALLKVLESAEFSVRVDEVSAELGRACEAARAVLGGG